tara:strand:- start:162 stop:653 length:492 start_codon:yes stop_codon:yes gene_type:complete
MGSGKTTIGRILARKMKKQFIDSDHEIELRTGAKIPLIFEIEGEIGFRKREAKVISELTSLKNIVLATGGGVILSEKNRRFLKERGIVVYLQASVNSLVQRTSYDSNRPLIKSKNPKSSIEKLIFQRKSLYEEIADIKLESGRPNVQLLVQKIITTLNKEQFK